MFAMLIFGEIVNHHITHIITLVLKVSTYIMTRIAGLDSQMGLSGILVIMSMSAFKTDVILYLFTI